MSPRTTGQSLVVSPSRSKRVCRLPCKFRGTRDQSGQRGEDVAVELTPGLRGNADGSERAPSLGRGARGEGAIAGFKVLELWRARRRGDRPQTIPGLKKIEDCWSFRAKIAHSAGY